MAVIHIKENIELVPHIEFSPTDFQPDNDAWEELYNIDPPNRPAYLQKCLAESGLAHVKPLAKGYFGEIRIRDITDDKMFEVIFKELDEECYPDIDMYYWRWRGLLCSVTCGISLLHNDEFIVPAQCCTNFDNIQDWTRAVENVDSRGMWNGHPEYHVHHENGDIWFSIGNDSINDTPPETLDDYKYRLPRDLLLSVLPDAHAEIETFGKRLMAYWETHHKP